MPPILGILQHTPWWVFALLAVLVFQGTQALKPRTVPLARPLIVPAVFIVWGLVSLALRPDHSPLLVLDWLCTALVGGTVGWALTHLEAFRFDASRGLVGLPGSRLPLVRNLLIFSAKYAIGMAIAMSPAWSGPLVLLDIAVSGLSAGYFIAWAARFWLAYRTAAAPGNVPPKLSIPVPTEPAVRSPH